MTDKIEDKRVSFEVRTEYTFNGSFVFDEVAFKAAGRTSDFSGSGFGRRDLGWNCRSEFEAERIKHALDKIGLCAAIYRE